MSVLSGEIMTVHFQARKFAGVLLFLSLLFFMAFCRIAYSAEYRLGPGDELDLSVFDHPELSASKKIIQADGSISIPRIGRVSASNIGISALKNIIEEKLMNILGISNPSVSIEITRYRQFYVAGYVANPGSYEYVPDITALQAISLAGGLFRLSADNLGSFLELARVRERLAQYREQIAISLVRRERFLAERDDTKIAIPEEINSFIGPDRKQSLVNRESDLIEKRRNAYLGELSILTDLGEELDKEISALKAQRSAKEEQLKLIVQEADTLRSLKERQLVTQSRSLAIDRERISTEADVLEVTALIARSQTSRRRIDQDKLNLTTKRNLEILNGLKEEDDTIALLRHLIDAGQRQLGVADGLPISAQQEVDSTIGSRALIVVRADKDEAKTLPIGLNEKILPGDVLYVPRLFEGASNILWPNANRSE